MNTSMSIFIYQLQLRIVIQSPLLADEWLLANTAYWPHTRHTRATDENIVAEMSTKSIQGLFMAAPKQITADTSTGSNPCVRIDARYQYVSMLCLYAHADIQHELLFALILGLGLLIHF